MHYSKEEGEKLAKVWQAAYDAYQIMEDMRPGGGFTRCDEFVRINPHKAVEMIASGVDLYAKLRRQ